jgi:WD40 repeat protein
VAAIFISHSSRDNLLAEEIKAWLVGQGYEKVFLDFDKDTGLGVGEEWERQLYKQIGRCHAVLLLVTPAWMESKWCFAEFTQARALGKLVFPLIVTANEQTLVAPPLNTIQAERWDEAGQDHLARRLREVAEEIARGHRWDPARPPWPGILAFEAEDAAVFFGRDLEIRKVCELLEARRAHGGARLVLIVGASGGGKSSVLKAGVLPYLARDRRRYVTLPPFRPGQTPLRAFAKVLAEALGRPVDVAAIRAELAGPDARLALADYLEVLTVGPAREATVLISIDQFEELVTIAGDRERDDFLRLLSAATAADREQALPILVVATIRSDLLGEILKAKGFAVAHDVFTLGSLPFERLASVIEGPAQIAAIHLEEGLVDRILGDVGTGTEALPLLAFTLRELQQRYGGDKKLALLEYEELGDRERNLRPLENAVRRTAEETLAAEAPSPEELASLREAFVGHLVRVNEDGVRLRRPARLGDVPAAARRLIERLVAVRLLSIRSEGNVNAVEVAHEALFKAWPQLAAWLDEEQNFLIGRRQIEDAERLWVATPDAHKHKALLSGLLLERAREWTLAHPERLKRVHDFVAASIRKADLELAASRRRQQILTFGSALVAVVFAGLSILAWFQTQYAEKQTQTIRVVQRLSRPTGDATAPPQRNLLLSSQLARLRADDDSSGVPLAAIDALRQQLRLTGGVPLVGHRKSTSVAAFSPSGRWLATGSDDGMLRLWDVSGSQPKSLVLLESGSKIGAAAFSADSKWLFNGDDTGTIRAWEIGDAASAHRTSSPGLGAIQALVADPKGRWLAFGTQTGKVCLWKLSDEGFSEAPCGSYGHPKYGIAHLRFSAQGRWLAAAGSVPPVRISLWDLSAGSLPARPKQFGIGGLYLNAMAFSGDEARLAVVKEYNAEVWDLTEDNPPLHVLGRGGHLQWINAVALSPDGRWLATGGSDSRTKFWEVGGSPDPVQLEGHTAPVNSVTFSDDGKWLATSSGDATARLWNMSGPRTIPGIVLRGQDFPTTGVIFKPGNDPTKLVTVGKDQHARLWTIADLTADPVAVTRHGGAIIAATQSADGKWVAGSGTADGQLLIRSVESRDAPTRSVRLPPVAGTDQQTFAREVAISPNGRWLAVMLDGSKRLYLWRFPEMGSAFDLSMEDFPGDTSLGFSSDNRWLIAGTWDRGIVHFWDMSGDSPSTESRHKCEQNSPVRNIGFSADGQYAVTGSESAGVFVWDLRAANPCAAPRRLALDQDTVRRVAISPDGRWAAAATAENEAKGKGRLWDISAGGKPRQVIEVALGERGTAAAISADGHWVAFGDWAGGIAVIDLRAPEPLRAVVLPGHFGRTNSVAFTPDSRMLITSGEDRVVRLWNPADLADSPVVLHGHEGTVQIVGISPDSGRLITSDDNGSILQWHLSLPELAAIVCRTAGRQLTRQELRDFPETDPAKLPCLDQPKLSE